MWKAFGDNNRTCLVRTVAGRLELRLPDPSCNVYAAIAATLAAGLHGIESDLIAPPACDEDLYECFALGEQMPGRLPADLGQAVNALARDEVLCQAIGPGFCHQFMALKRLEWDRYNQTVSQWELQSYADAF